MTQSNARLKMDFDEYSADIGTEHIDLLLESSERQFYASEHEFLNEHKGWGKERYTQSWEAVEAASQLC